MARPNASRIDELAAMWVARLDRGLTPQEQAEFDAWLAADDRHLGAYGRMGAMFLHTERAISLGPDFRPDHDMPPVRTGLGRRGLIQGAVAASVVACAGGAWWWTKGERYTTGLGEVRVIALNDGSVATLGTGSTILVRYAASTRLIELVRGEALFDVAKDAARPFVVMAGNLSVRAVGTSFSVTHPSAGALRVLVQEGVVEARLTTAHEVAPLRLAANMKATVQSDQVLAAQSISADESQRELIWRDGLLLFDGQTLREAAAQFARYSDTAVIIDDPKLASEEISGSYQANDPVGFARAAAQSLGAHVQVSAGEVRLAR